MDLAPKPASASRTIQTQILLSQHINGSGRLFGGQLMQWIDIVAAVAARRHAGGIGVIANERHDDRICRERRDAQLRRAKQNARRGGAVPDTVLRVLRGENEVLPRLNTRGVQVLCRDAAVDEGDAHRLCRRGGQQESYKAEDHRRKIILSHVCFPLT